MTRHFVSKPSEAYKAAVRALKDLMKAEGGDVAGRACAEAMSQYHKTVYAERQHRPWTDQQRVQLIESEKSHVCVERLKGAKRCPETMKNPCGWPTGLPGQDHLSEWQASGKTKDMVSFCDRHGLQANISAGSWHFLGSTLLLEYSKLRTGDTLPLAEMNTDLTISETDRVANAILSLCPASLSKQDRALWNQWRLEMWVLADKARDAATWPSSVLKIGEMERLRRLVDLIPALK
jgi:hypothetical protein